MAKSEAEKFITLAELEKKGYAPVIFRYLVLGAHYRTKLNFTWESLEAARNGLERLYEEINDYFIQTQSKNYDEAKLISAKGAKTLQQYEEEFNLIINDDLNTPQALGILHAMLADNENPSRKLALLKKFDTVLGLGLDVPMNFLAQEDEKVAEMKLKYQQCRANKQFVQSDALRKEIEALGFEVRDTENGPQVVKKFF
jgi:cysteinyl-tRNA synthetase